MALRGNLKDFSLPDVFQLVTFSRKTGVLRITRADGAQGTVWFRDGDVFFASSNWHKELLGERLVKAQRVTSQALKRALELRSQEGEEGRRLGQILVDEGYITDRVLEEFVSEQIQDTIFDLMRWDEGDFDFEAMPEVVDEDIGLAISIENVVMEGSRRLEEWTRIKKKIPSMDVVFKMATAPGEGTFEISLKPMEWQLLLLIDGSRSVAELAEVTNRTDFEVARIVYGLFSAGLLEFATDEEIERNRAERIEREATLAEIVAAREAEEAAARAAALERETQLAVQAEGRQRAQERDAAAAASEAAASAAREAADAATIEAARAARTEPEEEPEFLGGGTIAPAASDEAVLEEFMGAVLQKPVVSEPETETPTPTPEPYVPVEEPAFMSAQGSAESEMPVMPVTSAEELLGIEVAAPVETASSEDHEQPEAAPAWIDEPTEPEIPPSVAGAVAAEQFPEEVSTAAEPVEVLEVRGQEPELSAGEPSGVYGEEAPDFERGLLALGLGELPADLLSPLGQPELPVPAPEEPTPEALAFEVPAPEEPTPEALAAEVPTPAALASEVPAEDMPIAETASAELGFEQVFEPMSEIHQAAEMPADGLEELVSSLGLSGELPEALELQPHEVAAEPDFSELLESLDVDGSGGTPLEAEAFSEGFDEELLRDEPAAPGGVISTDAFLEDITIDDLGFSGGLTDELSALTGAQRKMPSRPQANVKAIPEPNGSVLRRDARVDKDTLLKIIDGIKNL